eukprot:g4982.t1
MVWRQANQYIGAGDFYELFLPESTSSPLLLRYEFKEIDGAEVIFTCHTKGEKEDDLILGPIRTKFGGGSYKGNLLISNSKVCRICFSNTFSWITPKVISFTFTLTAVDYRIQSINSSISGSPLYLLRNAVSSLSKAYLKSKYAATQGAYKTSPSPSPKKKISNVYVDKNAERLIRNPNQEEERIATLHRETVQERLLQDRLNEKEESFQSQVEKVKSLQTLYETEIALASRLFEEKEKYEIKCIQLEKKIQENHLRRENNDNKNENRLRRAVEEHASVLKSLKEVHESDLDERNEKFDELSISYNKLKQAKEKYEDRLNSVMEEHNCLSQLQGSKHSDEVDSLKKSLHLELQCQKSNYMDEIDSLKDEHNNQLQYQNSNYMNEVNSLKDSHHDQLQQQLQETESMYIQELDSLNVKHRNQLLRQLNAATTKHMNKMESFENTHMNKMESFENTHRNKMESFENTHRNEMESFENLHHNQMHLELNAVKSELQTELDTLKSTHQKELQLQLSQAASKHVVELDSLKMTHQKELQKQLAAAATDTFDALKMTHHNELQLQLSEAASRHMALMENTKHEFTEAIEMNKETINSLTKGHASTVDEMEEMRSQQKFQLNEIESAHAEALLNADSKLKEKEIEMENVTKNHQLEVRELIERHKNDSIQLKEENAEQIDDTSLWESLECKVHSSNERIRFHRQLAEDAQKKMESMEAEYEKNLLCCQIAENAQKKMESMEAEYEKNLLYRQIAENAQKQVETMEAAHKNKIHSTHRLFAQNTQKKVDSMTTILRLQEEESEETIHKLLKRAEENMGSMEVKMNLQREEYEKTLETTECMMREASLEATQVIEKSETAVSDAIEKSETAVQERLDALMLARSMRSKDLEKMRRVVCQYKKVKSQLNEAVEEKNKYKEELKVQMEQFHKATPQLIDKSVKQIVQNKHKKWKDELKKVLQKKTKSWTKKYAKMEDEITNRVLAEAGRSIDELKDHVECHKENYRNVLFENDLLGLALIKSLSMKKSISRSLSTESIESIANRATKRAKQLEEAAMFQKQIIEENFKAVNDVDFSKEGQSLQTALGMNTKSSLIPSCTAKEKHNVPSEEKRKIKPPPPPWAKDVLLNHEDILAQEQVQVNETETEALVEGAIANVLNNYLADRQKFDYLVSLESDKKVGRRRRIKNSPGRPKRGFLRLVKSPFLFLMPTLEFKVGMTCGGCSGAVTRIIGKTEGMTLVGEPNVETKQVLVKTELGHAAVEEALAKWSQAAGKSVEYVGEYSG